MPRRNRRIGRGDPGVKSAVRGREVAGGAGLAGEEQPIIDRVGQRRTAIRHARQRIRIGAARERVGAPVMHSKRLQPARERAAEQRAQFRYGEVEEAVLAFGFQRGGMAAAEIGLDHRPPERPQLVTGGRHAVGVTEYAAVWIEFVGIGKRDEQLVGKTERQAARGIRLLRQRRPK